MTGYVSNKMKQMPLFIRLDMLLSLLRHLPHIVIKGVLKTKTLKTPNWMTELID